MEEKILKNRLIIIGIAVLLICVGLSGCVNPSNSIYNIEITYHNNWDQYVDHTTEAPGYYSSGCLKTGITYNDKIPGYGDSFNLIITIYNNSDIVYASTNGYLNKSYALKIFYFNYTVTPEDNNFRFIVNINDYRNITAEKQ